MYIELGGCIRVGEALTKSRNWRADLGGAIFDADDDMWRYGVTRAAITERIGLILEVVWTRIVK